MNNTLRKQLEALRDDYKKDGPFLPREKALCDTFVERIDAILAEQGEQAPGLREAAQAILKAYKQGGYFSDADRARDFFRLDAALSDCLSASPSPSPAPDASLRNDVAAEIFYLDSDFCGGKWETEPENQKEYWREKADRILRLCGEGQLREAIERVVWGEYKHERLSEAQKQSLDDRMQGGEDELFYAWAQGRLSLARELAALQRTPEPPSREMERKAFVAGAIAGAAFPNDWRAAEKWAEAEAARRYGGSET